MHQPTIRTARAARTALAVLLPILLSGFAGAAAGSGNADAAEPSGLQVPAKEFRARVRSVALVPLFIPRMPRDFAELKSRYDSLLVSGFKSAGLRPIPAEAWTSAKRSVTDSIGIAVDPATGRPDMKKADLIVRETKRRVAQRHGAFDAIVYPSVRRDVSGWFLHVDIVNAREALLYRGQGRIVRAPPREKGSGALPPYESFSTDAARDAQAVESALQPLRKALAGK